MTLAAQANGGPAYSVSLAGFNTHSATFRSGSTLYLAEGGNVTFDSGVGTTNAVIESGARLVSLAATVNPLATTTHTNFINQADAITGPNFATANNGVYSYQHTVTPGTGANDGAYSLTVTRLADASAVTGGAAGSFLSGLERYFRGLGAAYDPANGINLLTDGSAPWLYTLADLENLPTRAGVQAAGRNFFRQVSPQATTQSLQALSRGQQVVTRQFKEGLLGSFAGSPLDGGLYPEYPPAAGDGQGGRFTLWGAPFYHTGSQDGDSLYTDLDQDFTGFNLGATWWGGQNDWGEAAVSASFNYLNSDFDGQDGYSAEADGYGFSLGLAAKFNGAGQWNPRAALYGGWMTHDLDQRRRVGGMPFGNGTYRSNTDADVRNLGLSLDNDFYFNPCTILRPRLAFDYASTSLNGYTERGPADGFAQKVKADDFDSFRSDLGASLIWRASQSIAMEGRADWYHEFGDTEASLVSRTVAVPDLIFVTDGLDPGRDSGSVGASLTWTPPAADNFSLQLDYDYHFGAGYSGSKIAGLLKVDF